MAALCPYASLETLRPLCYRGTHRFQGGSLPLLSRGISLGCPGCDAFGKPCPPKQPTVCSPGGWGLDSPTANPGHWQRPDRSSAATPESFWPCGKIHFWPLKTVVLSGFTTLFSTSSWYTGAPVFTPFSQKWRGVTRWWYTSHQTMT